MDGQRKPELLEQKTVQALAWHSAFPPLYLGRFLVKSYQRSS